MLTYIGIGIIVCAAALLYLRKCLVITEKTTNKVIFDWGVTPSFVLTNGWNFVFWPLHQAKAVIPTAVRAYDMPKVTFTVRIDDTVTRGSGQVSTLHQDAVGELKTQEVSLAYQFFFWTNEAVQRLASTTFSIPSNFSTQTQLRTFFDFVSLNPDGSINFGTLEERIKDFLHAKFNDLDPTPELYEGINFPKARLDRIRVALQEQFWTIGLPIRIVSLERNAPFLPLGALATAMTKRASDVVELEGGVLAAKNAQVVAAIDVQTQRSKGEAEGAREAMRISGILAAYGLTEFPPAEKLAALLSLRQLDVYEKIAGSPSSKIIVLPAEIARALSQLTGVKPS